MQAEDHDQILKGRRVLVVEDQFLIADDMRRAVVRLGGEVMGPVGQVAAAAALARTSGRPDLALLDINLHGESVYDFADEMRAQEVPVILATGYGRAWTPGWRSASIRRAMAFRSSCATSVIAAGRRNASAC